MNRSAPQRILFHELNEDGTVGGSHRCLHDIVAHLDRTRFEPLVLFYQSNPYVEKLKRLGAQVFVWEAERRREIPPLGRFRRPRMAARMAGAVARRAKFIRRHRIDLVHGNNTPYLTVEDWLPAARLLRCPVISHCRADVPRGMDAVRRRLAGRFDAILSISGGVTRSLVLAGVPTQRIVQIYDGVDLAAVRAAVRTPPEEVRRAIGVGPGEALAVMVGHLRSWKGQDVLLEAVARMDAILRARLRVAFAGEENPHERGYAESLRQRVAAHGLARNVTFLGARDDAADLMNAADVVVHASTIPEPLGLVVIEAMALGKPVVASRLGGPSETIVPGAGLLFDPDRPGELAEILLRVLSDPDLRRALGEGGRSRAAAFDIGPNVRGLEAVYDRILGSRPPDRS